jgi:hypothetical protein
LVGAGVKLPVPAKSKVTADMASATAVWRVRISGSA